MRPLSVGLVRSIKSVPEFIGEVRENLQKSCGKHDHGYGQPVYLVVRHRKQAAHDNPRFREGNGAQSCRF